MQAAGRGPGARPRAAVELGQQPSLRRQGNPGGSSPGLGHQWLPLFVSAEKCINQEYRSGITSRFQCGYSQQQQDDVVLCLPIFCKIAGKIVTYPARLSLVDRRRDRTEE